MPAARRFPPPWDIEEANASCFIVKDNNSQALAYVYFESDPGRRTAANLLTRDEARRIALPYRKSRSAARSPACASGVRSLIDQYAEDGCEQRSTEHGVDRFKCAAVSHQTAPN
jgi:hypothetical protein